MNRLNIVDMFCGGGGESTGLIEVAYVIRDKSTLSDPDAGVTYVIRDKRILSDPNAKIYIDKSYSEEISIFYDQIK